MQMSNLFRNKKEPEIICQSNKSKGVGYLVDLLCATRIGKKAPKLYENRGYKMAVFSNDYIGILINQFGVYEQDELELLFEFLKPIDNVLIKGAALDIGANIGNHSLYFSPYFQKIYCYEPSPDTYKLLEMNVKSSDNIEVYNYGLGDEEGVFFMKENRTNIGGSSVVHEKSDETIQIQIVKLDNYINELSNINFIKIDVEGFEEKVFRGGLRFIQAHQPIIVFEQDEMVFDEEETPSIVLLRKLGYQFCWQHKEKRIKSTLLRKFVNFYRIVLNPKIKIVTGSRVPKQFHSMLIAIPPRFSSLLDQK